MLKDCVCVRVISMFNRHISSEELQYPISRENTVTVETDFC